MSNRNNYLKRKYGITQDDYEDLLFNQNGRCFICHNKPKTRALCVDHDHKTREIRGLLCTRCNHDLLGAAHDSPELLKRALQYLEDPPARYVLVDENGNPKQENRSDRNSAKP